mgnify:CR=1 FL=1
MASLTELTISKDSSKKHYYHAGVTATVQTTGSISSTIEGYTKGKLALTFVKLDGNGNKVDSTTKEGSASNLPLASSASFSGSVTGQYNYKVYGIAYQGWSDGSLWQYINTDKLTGTASYTYGSKATPSISASFRGGYIRPDVANTIIFTSNKINYIDEQYTVESGTLRYKLSSASSWTSINFTGNSVTIPANTLSSGQTYNMDATIVTDDGISVSVTFNDVSTVDATPTVTGVSPNGTVGYGNVAFTWLYAITTGTPQSAYELRYKVDEGAYVSTGKVMSSATQAIVNIPTSGTVAWSVRAYNQDDVASDWSGDLTFVNVAPPQAPTITSISATSRPVITWSSADQIAYQVQILNNDEVLEDSGMIYSGSSTYTSENYYPDGSYLVKVRIVNQYGRTSDWASNEFTVASTLTAPPFTLSSTPDGVQITITTSGAFSTYYIQRDGVTIAQTDGSYIDRFGNGEHTYTVIGVNGNDGAQSSQSITSLIEHTSVITEDGTIYEVNHRMGSPVGISFQVNAVFDTAEYIGASVPEHTFAKMREKRYSIVFKDYVDVEKLLGETVYYADIYGNGDWCVITAIGRVENQYGNETTAELQVTKHDEAIDYA